MTCENLEKLVIEQSKQITELIELINKLCPDGKMPYTITYTDD